jgi:hypothetical protein
VANFESSRGGRRLISALLIVLLLGILVNNLPRQSHLQERLSNLTEPYMNALGLDQYWGVFAPDPRRHSIEFEARIEYRDGSSEIWRPPDRDPVIGAYWDYRWRKYAENAVLDQSNLTLWDPTAAWIAREHRERDPVRVLLFRRIAKLTPPGKDADEPPRTRTLRFLTFKVTPDVLGEDG